jgi:hypothetical protein
MGVTSEHLLLSCFLFFRLCVNRNGNTGEQHLEPCPRFAHQLVYDHIKMVCF